MPRVGGAAPAVGRGGGRDPGPGRGGRHASGRGIRFAQGSPAVGGTHDRRAGSDRGVGARAQPGIGVRLEPTCQLDVARIGRVDLPDLVELVVVHQPIPGRIERRHHRRLRLVDPELAPQRGDRPELQSADRSLLLAHHLGRLAGGEAGEEAEGDGVALVVGQGRQGDPDRFDLLAGHRQLVRSGLGAGPLGRLGEVGVLVARPDEIDDRVPCQAEQPAPERDAALLVARQCLQGLDEDQLRQVLRVARAPDAAGDESIDRQVVVVEQSTECPGVPRLGFSHQPLDRGVVQGHNDSPGTALGPGVMSGPSCHAGGGLTTRLRALGGIWIVTRSVPGARRKVEVGEAGVARRSA